MLCVVFRNVELCMWGLSLGWLMLGCLGICFIEGLRVVGWLVGGGVVVGCFFGVCLF